MTDREYIDSVAADLGATIFFDAASPGGRNGPRSNIIAREVHLTPWEQDNTNYWTALHELGHIAANDPVSSQLTMTRLQYGIPGEDLIVQEAQAWAWALDHANRPLDDIGRTVIAYSLASYFDIVGAYPEDRDVLKVIEAAGPVSDYSTITDHEFQHIARPTWNRVQEHYQSR